ncbi:MAG: hypothetical protein MNPFHGCM_03263 [Gemmatimonadaceae bacterium]|nr:hypothetical protein [Gemmatimonadaceae bacterium]
MYVIPQCEDDLAMERRVYIPTAGISAWRARLADPDGHWVRGRSAFETAVVWERGSVTERGLDSRLATLLDQASELRGAQLVASFPEHKVSLPGGSRASQNDVWAILRSDAGLASLAVEGKAGESFAETIADWRSDDSAGKSTRLTFLAKALGLSEPVNPALRYQLLHRTASAVLEAGRIGARTAAMVVLSFAPDDRSKEDFLAFATSLGATGAIGKLARARSTSGCVLYLGWLDLPAASDSEIASLAV